MYDKILVPIDGSESSMETAKHAAEFASKLGGAVTLFHVVSPLPAAIQGTSHARKFLEEMLRHGEEALKDAKKEIASFNLQVDLDMVVGGPAVEICQKAENEQYDLIIIGSKGLSKNRGFKMGSVSKRVVRHAHCPVLIVR
ncbi:universal stress protein [Desulfoscipio geothermicus]|uniref:Nucleotide-binding universal stress protein, UspA family n=1 Tax=Desulfoscipio geothermicus DSM 3669 TaxID=1121426 RepID=A0A1I6DYN2_9FIRM|nr:universal stress protein [Desulfoscipio geothermicus]SFR10545.1 Nucleotide-binding universal stress protein, UspA family [Desulfoscipio geothermicus DSM 3669]